MTASRGNGHLSPQLSRPALLVAVLLGVGLGGLHSTGVARAQGEEAAGPQTAPPLEAPTPLLPFDPSLRQPKVGGTADDAPVVSGIEINPLSERDPDSLGLLDASSGGFGRDLWAGSARDRIVELMGLLPDSYRSAVLRDLARRLLLSRGDRPGGGPAAAGGAESAEPDLSLLVLRIDRLSAVGDIDGLARFLEIVPRRYDEEPIARARVETALLSGDITRGCDEVQRGMPLYFSVPYWQKALIACQLVAGETEKAQLGIGLLKERGLPEDSDFLALAAALTGADAKLSPELAAEPLPFALLQARGQTLPPGTEDRADLAVLAAMARSARTSLPQRAVAAERAVAVGALPSDALARLYDQFAFDGASLQASAVSEGAALEGRALAYQRTGQAPTAVARAQTIAEALDAAWRLESGYVPLAAALESRIDQIPRLRETLPYGGAIGRALYADGRYELANAWLSFLQKAAASRKDAAAAATALWPYWRLAGGVAAVPDGGIASWQATQAKNDPQSLSHRRALLQAALQALDATLAPRAGAAGEAAAEADGPAPAVAIDELERAAIAGRRGETVLIALANMAGRPLDAVDPAMLGAVLTALSDVGFELEARGLAIETALAARI